MIDIPYDKYNAHHHIFRRVTLFFGFCAYLPGPGATNTETYLMAMARLQDALTFFQSNNSQSVELENVMLLFTSGTSGLPAGIPVRWGCPCGMECRVRCLVYAANLCFSFRCFSFIFTPFLMQRMISCAGVINYASSGCLTSITPRINSLSHVVRHRHGAAEQGVQRPGLQVQQAAAAGGRARSVGQGRRPGSVQTEALPKLVLENGRAVFWRHVRDICLHL